MLLEVIYKLLILTNGKYSRLDLIAPGHTMRSSCV